MSVEQIGGFFRGLRDEIRGVKEGWKPEDLARDFTIGVFCGIGVYKHPEFMYRSSSLDLLQERFTAHLLNEVFPPGHNPEYTIDGRKHALGRNLEERLGSVFPHQIMGSDCERAIDLEARYILLTVIIPNLRENRMDSLFVEDFISTIKGRPRESYAFMGVNDLRGRVYQRLDSLSQLLLSNSMGTKLSPLG